MEKAWIFLTVIPFITFGQTNTFPSTGNVGIGTLSPEAKLKVVRSSNIGGTWNPTSSIFTIAEAGNSLIMDPNEIFGSKTLYIGSKSGDIVHFRTVSETAAIDRMVINSIGNVGIGTISPQGKLHVTSGTSGDAILRLEADTDNNNESDNPLIQIRQDGGLSGINMGYSEENFGSNFFGIGTLFSGQENWDIFTINTANGNIGIGTKSPDAKLTVKGKIHAEEVKIDLSVPAPDYVFKEGYKLMSLEDIQQFIKEHGHLPNIPSAKDMEENGVELGVMNMKLLEKIEELTLFILNQQREIEKNSGLEIEVECLKIQNMDLAKRLETLENR